jgi:DNA-binding NarL/FixJ family response regulator
VRILLADDHPDLLLIVSDLLNSMFDVVGAVGDGESLLNAAAYLQPDVAFGYVVKPRLASDLVHAIREALADRIFISPSVPTASSR